MSFTYVDSSVLLRWALSEPRQVSPQVLQGGLVSSEIVEVECYRVLDRLRFSRQIEDTEVATASRMIRAMMPAIRLVGLDRSILDRAKEPFSLTVKTLDALHLSTAILMRSEVQGLAEEPRFLTHDSQLGRAALAYGFRVSGT